MSVWMSEGNKKRKEEENKKKKNVSWVLNERGELVLLLLLWSADGSGEHRSTVSGACKRRLTVAVAGEHRSMVCGVGPDRSMVSCACGEWIIIIMSSFCSTMVWMTDDASCVV
jgi:hypothetical protein